MADDTETPSLCCCSYKRLGAEWRLSLFGVEDYNGKILDVETTFAPDPKWLVAIFRLAVLIWGSLGIYDNLTIPDYYPSFFFAYYTNWSVVVAAVYVLFSLISTLQMMTKPSQEVNWVLKATWILYSLGASAQLAATVLYWVLVYNGGTVIYLDVLKHGYFCAAVIFDGAVVSRIPLRFKSLIALVIYNFVYILWTVIHGVTGVGNPSLNDTGFDDDAIYAVLNWNKRPWTAAFWAFASNVIIFPLLFFFLWFLGSCGGGCKFDGSSRRYVTESVTTTSTTDEEKKLQPAAVYGTAT